jgi:hypothetical protein
VDGDCLAAIWKNGAITNLNDLIAPGFNGVLINAQDINDEGTITGRAFDPATGTLKAFVAVPITESKADKSATPSAVRAKVVLPEEVKQAIRQQRGLASLSH